MRYGVGCERVGTEGANHNIGAETGNRVQHLFERRQIGWKTGATGQRQVECRTLADALTDLVGMTPEIGIVRLKVGVVDAKNTSSRA